MSTGSTRSAAGKTPPALGFLTIADQGEAGYSGGYLALNAAGRPLEFHCTAPVKPNRVQQVLYGPTLEAYLFGEQIAQALVSKAAARPAAVITDCPAVLAGQQGIEAPLLWLRPPTSDGEPPAAAGTGERSLRIDGPQGLPAPLRLLRLGSYCLAALQESHETGAGAERGPSEADLHALLEPWSQDFDLAEPFQRIAEALEEAQRGAR